METIVYLMRHGETEENRAHILQGHLPGKLTPEGIGQAEEAGKKLVDMGIEVIVASDLQRCVDTTEIVNRYLHCEVVYTDLLRERNWGSCTGMMVDGTHRIVIPDDAETMKQMKARARRFLSLVRKDFAGKTVLVVSHGLFCRCLRAVHGGLDMAEVARMGNAEIVKIDL